MATTRQEIEQKLVEQAQEAIRKMLAGLPESSEITLKDMEAATGVLGQRLMQASLQGLVETEQVVTRGEQYCEHCQARLSRRVKRKKRVVTVNGEVEVERDYYLCSQCGTGFSPWISNGS